MVRLRAIGRCVSVRRGGGGGCGGGGVCGRGTSRASSIQGCWSTTRCYHALCLTTHHMMGCNDANERTDEATAGTDGDTNNSGTTTVVRTLVPATLRVQTGGVLFKSIQVP